MIGYLILFLIIINIFMIFRKKNSKIISFLSFVSIWVIMGLNTYTDDYPGYMRLYDSQTIGLTMEPGFTLLTKVAFQLKFDYQIFLGIYFFIVSLVLAIAVIKITKNYHVFICIFSLTALYTNVDEIRQYFAYVLYALALISLSSREKGKLKYSICILIASTMQISSIVLLPFPFILSLMKNKNKFFSRYLIFILVLCFIVFLNGNRIPFLVEILSLVIPKNKLVYFNTKTNFGFILFFLANFLNLLIARFAVNEMRKHPLCYSNRECRFAQNLYYSIIYLSFAMPLCMVNSEFLRYFRFSVIPCILVIAITFNRYYKSKISIRGRGIVVFNSNLAFLLYIGVYQLCMQNWRIVEQVLENNIFNF